MKTKAQLLLFTLGALLSNSGYAALIELVPSSSTIQTGESLSIEVLVSGIAEDDSIFAFGFDVAADPELSLVGADVGPSFLDDSDFFDAEVAGSTFVDPFNEGTFVNGDSILLASLNFLAGTTSGLFSVSIATDPASFGIEQGLFTLGSLEALSGTVSILVNADDSVAVPEPTTLGLLSAGLLGIVAVRRRQRF